MSAINKLLYTLIFLAFFGLLLNVGELVSRWILG